MLRALKICFLAITVSSGLWAVPFYWESKTEEPGFTIDIPSLWTQASRSRDKVANVHFERKDRFGRVAIGVRWSPAENTDLEQLVLQLRTRLAVKYGILSSNAKKLASVKTWKNRCGMPN